jgi:poly-gamma-glutamate capsule biosynthesis protein CapA/YwtB (metallophosphatase superfamily)
MGRGQLAWLVAALIVTAWACALRPEEEDILLVAFPTPAALSPVATASASPTLVATPAPISSLEQVFALLELGPVPHPQELRVLVATGDIIPARYVDVIIRRHGDDFLYPVEDVKEVTAAADLTVVNLEAPLIASCPYHDSGYVFCGRPGVVAALQAMGVDVATLENNHIGDYGPQGVAETVAHLQAAGIAWADRRTMAVKEVRGLTFGFLAFNGVGEYFDRRAIAQAIREADGQVDVLVVAFHWGAEYVRLPQPAPGIAPDDPQEIAHLAVDAGADLVLGNHPHWVQAVELYKGKLIVYAHGNFIFDQMWSLETRIGVIGRYTFYGPHLVKVEFLPYIIEDYARPRLLKGKDAEAVLVEMEAASRQLAALGASSGGSSGP